MDISTVVSYKIILFSLKKIIHAKIVALVFKGPPTIIHFPMWWKRASEYRTKLERKSNEMNTS